MTTREQNVAKAQRAYELRRELLAALAPEGRCALCSKKPRDTKYLHVDHVDGRDWSLHAHSRWGRVYRYWREYREGVRLRALCLPCNNRNRPPGTRSVPHARRSAA